MDWFPRAFGLMLAVLAGTFVFDLFRTGPHQPTLLPGLCPWCIYENENPGPDGGIHTHSRCSWGPVNRKCPQCRSEWKSSQLTLEEWVDEPGARALVAVAAGLLWSVPFFRCPTCRGRRRLSSRGGTSVLRSCFRCKDRGFLGAWSRLFAT